MPNTKSAIRRVQKTNLQTSINKIRKSKYKAVIKQMSNYIALGKTKEAREFLPKFHSQLMKQLKLAWLEKKQRQEKFLELQKEFKIQKNKLINHKLIN